MKQKRATVMILLSSSLCLAHVSLAAACEEGKSAEKDENKILEPKSPSILKRFLGDAGEIWTSPMHWNGRDVLCFGAVAAATGLAIGSDESIYRRIKAWQAKTGWVGDVSPVLSDLSEGTPFGIAGLFLLHGLVFKDTRSRETGIMALEAMVQSFMVVQTCKHLTGRQRPSISGEDYWYGPAGMFKRYSSEGFSRYDAFFSGHTVTIWSLATVVASQYRGAVPWIAYGVAALSGLATITEDLHWLSDVVLGAAVGYAIGKFVVRNGRRRWHLAPLASRQGMGVSLVYGF